MSPYGKVKEVVDTYFECTFDFLKGNGSQLFACFCVHLILSRRYSAYKAAG